MMNSQHKGEEPVGLLPKQAAFGLPRAVGKHLEFCAWRALVHPAQKVVTEILPVQPRSFAKRAWGCATAQVVLIHCCVLQLKYTLAGFPPEKAKYNSLPGVISVRTAFVKPINLIPSSILPSAPPKAGNADTLGSTCRT